MLNNAWFFLFLASALEVCWTYCVKFVSIAKLKGIDWSQFFSSPAGFHTLIPAIGYVVFGVGNIFFFSRAMNTIPAATAFAVWTGTALVGVKLVDTLVLKEPFSPWHVLFIGLILVGIAGLKRTVA